ncbi:hypothetical protein [Paucisalibacillus sp. EB02]|uniref:hypothetical protein n=1 Tax=Paucisalibacillus sp. EB02 TaxID=1347087 RepID=UPI0004B6117D|nr:hypothetical protein [Paucisalibacillus sp. EB02]
MVYDELLFNTYDLYSVIEIRQKEVKDTIIKEDEDYLLNVGQEQYIMYLKDKFQMATLVLKLDEVDADVKEEQIRAEFFPQSFFVRDGQTYPREVYYFHIPFEGESDLFKCRPSTYTLSPPRAEVKGRVIIRRFIQFQEDIENINSKYKSFLDNLSNMVSNVNKDVKEYNNGLEDLIKSLFHERKAQILKRRNQHSGLIVPIRKKSDVPTTFSIPSPKVKKKVQIKPIQNKQDYTPVPTLNNDEYQDILRIINDMGKEFERKPSVYKEKGEEDLRDHFLMMLEPNFEGSATGETFNKSGKTDILLRYEGSNVFVAECKFWTGPKGFLKTIDQLLGYLTWRDSKAAIIMFVSNKDFSSVIKTAKDTIGNHPNFIKYNNASDESWSNYTFHTNGDKNNEIKLALMLYHTP